MTGQMSDTFKVMEETSKKLPAYVNIQWKHTVKIKAYPMTQTVKEFSSGRLMIQDILITEEAGARMKAGCSKVMQDS